MPLDYYHNRPRMSLLIIVIITLNAFVGLVSIENPYLELANAQVPPDDHPEWLDPTFDYRFELHIDPSQFDFKMVNYPVDWDVNLTSQIKDVNFKLDPTSLLLVEYEKDPSGTLLPLKHPTTGGPFGEYAVAFRSIKNNNDHIQINWILTGVTIAERVYCLYMSSIGPSNKTMNLPSPIDPFSIGLLDSNCWIQRGMDFYGHNPGEQTGWPDVDEIEVIGLHDKTTVEVLNITVGTRPYKSLINTTVNKGQLWRFSTPDGMYFKISADKPVLASIGSAMSNGGSAKTFYPSSDRNLVGRDFLFAPYNMTNWHSVEYGIQIYGVEESRVSVFDATGAHIKELDVRKDNHTALLGLQTGKVYNIKSTGDIMLEQEAINGFTTLPSINGAPVGKKFFGSIQDFDGMQVLVWAYERANITMWDIDYGDMVNSFEATGPGLLSFRPLKGGQFKFLSTGNISVLLGSTEGGTEIENLGDDVTFIGGRNGNRDIQAVGINNPGPGSADKQYSGGGYSGIIFSFFDNNWIEAGQFRGNLNMGEYIQETGSDIHSTKPISFMTLGRGYTDKDAQHRWNDWGSYLAGNLRTPAVTQIHLQTQVIGIDIYPSPDEGAINDTMVHAVEPGKTTTFKVIVKNIGSQSEVVELSTGPAPAGWMSVLDRTSISLASQQAAEIILTVDVPLNEPKDRRVNISIRGDTVRAVGKSTNDTVYAEVVIDPIYYPDLDGEVVKFVDPGKTVIFNITLTNLGNAFDTIGIQANEPDQIGWVMDLWPRTVGLEPGKNATIKLNVTSPSRSLEGASVEIDLHSRSGAWPNRTDYHRTTTIVKEVRKFDVTSTEHLDIIPGGTGYINLTVNNTGNGLNNFRIQVINPGTGWTIAMPGTFGLGPELSSVQRLFLQVDGKDPTTGLWPVGPGNRTINLNVTDEVGTLKRLNVTVRVLQVFSLTLTAEQDELDIMANEVGHYVLVIRNTGNGVDTFTLHKEIKGTFDKEKLTLGPGQTGTINLTVPPPSSRDRHLIFDVVAVSEGMADSKATLILNTQYPSTGTYLSDLNCLWLLLVVVCVYSAVKVAEWKLKKRR